MQGNIQSDSKYPVEIIRSRRKTLQIEIHQDCSLIVRVPYRATKAQITAFIEEHRDWIDRHLAKMHDRIGNMPHNDRYSENEIRALTDLALYHIPPRVREYADRMGVSYGRVTIRCQKTRWGSCSSKGNLNFNCLLMALPEEVRDYVIVHELCHLIEPNHSRAFWDQVEKYCPDHKRLRKQLRERGDALFLRL